MSNIFGKVALSGVNKLAPKVNEGSLLEAFDDINDWTATNGTVAENNIQHKLGGKAITLTASADSGSPLIDKVINYDLSGMKNIGLWCYVHDITKLSKIFIWFTNTNFTNAFYSENLVANLHEGWNFIKILKSQFATSGSSPTWANPMTKMRMRIYSASGQKAVVTFGKVIVDQWTTPSIVWSMDGGHVSFYEKLFPYAMEKGVKLSSAIVSGDVASSAEYVTTAQLDDMYTAGVDLCNHSATHPNFVTGGLTDAQIKAEITTCRDYLLNRGYYRGANILVYPQNAQNAAVRALAKECGVLCARTSILTLQHNPTVGDDLWKLRNICELGNTTDLDTVKGYIDSAITNGMTIMFYGHLVMDTPGEETYAVSTATAQDLVDYIVETGIRSMTFSEWYNFYKSLNNG